MHFLRKVWLLSKGYWFNTKNKIASLYMGGILLLTIAIVYIQVLLNEWYNNFYSALQAYDAPQIIHYLWVFSGLAFAYIIVAVYSYYVRQLLTLRWRAWMTESFMARWLGEKKYYYIQIFGSQSDNPDQRISEDIKMFVDYFLQFTVGLFKAFLTLASFLVILWNLSDSFTFTLVGMEITIPHYLVWAAILYSIIGTVATHLVGRKLTLLRYMQQKFEANFRFALIRLREHAESVAFYGGERKELVVLNTRFRALLENFYSIITKEKQLTWLTSGYGQLAIIFPLLVSIPLYLRKTINLGGLMQIATAFGRVQDALSYFVDTYTQLADWRSVVNRLAEFDMHMESIQASLISETQQKGSLQWEESTTLSVQDLSITTPTEQVLIKNLTFHLNQGDNLLIRGTNGSGKSTLLRVIARLWPFATGHISMPPNKDILFLPQKPYIPLGTLRSVLAYPSDQPIEDSVLVKALQCVRLDQFSSRLDEEADWAHILSGGEQQRLSFARIFIHRPRWIISDECTSAIDEETEIFLFTELSRALPHATLISVGHRATLDQYHNKILYIHKESATYKLYTTI